jgi:hypothetical protein
MLGNTTTLVEPDMKNYGTARASPNLVWRLQEEVWNGRGISHLCWAWNMRAKLWKEIVKGNDWLEALCVDRKILLISTY